MSAFNISQYNLTPFNIQKNGEIWLEGDASVIFNFSFAGETFYCKGNSKTLIEINKLELNNGRIFTGNSQIVFSSEIEVKGETILTANFKEEFFSDIDISQRAYVKGVSSEKIESRLNLSQEAYCYGLSKLSIYSSKINISQLVNLLADSGEVFLGILDVISLKETSCEFPGLTLKPGETLIIDSGLYNILLNGENAVYYQNGEWIDELSRSTQSLIVTGTGATRLSVEILYTERFL